VFSDFVDIKLDEDHVPFGAFELSILAAAQASWADDTPPETPRAGSPNVVSFAAVERNGDWDALESDLLSPTSTNSRSPCSVMWNTDSPVDPTCKLIPSVSTHVAPCEYFKSPVNALELELFAFDDATSDDDLFLKEATTGTKRKSASTESMDTKKAKARQTRDALASEAQLRLLGADTPETKRMTHNVLERKRRNDLKASYQDLRENIPELVSQERAPTAQILQKAVEYIEYLKQAEEQLQSTMATMRAENDRLRDVYASF